MNKSLLFAVITALGTSIAHAQNLDAGTLSRQAEQKMSISAVQAAAPVSAAGATSQDMTQIDVREIELKGRNLLPENQLQPLLNEYIGKSTNLSGLQRLAYRVGQIYRANGYPFAMVVVPPQRIEQGKVILQISEGQINEVALNNQSRLSDKVANQYLQKAIQPNQAMMQADSERTLLLMQQLAGTDTVNYRRDNQSEQNKIVVDLSPAPSVDGFLQVDNYGSKSTGQTRTRVGVNLNSPLGRGERISAQAMSSFKGVNYARLSVDTPIGYRGFSTSLGVGHTRYDLGGAFKDLNATGNATSADWSVRYPLVLNNQHNVSLFGGMEYRKLKDEIGATDTMTRKNLQSVNVGVSSWKRYGSGITQFNLTNTFGHLKIKSTDALAIDQASAKTNGSYYKLNASLSRTQYFTPKFSATFGLMGQVANKNLDSAEQMSLGGVDGVAAYHANDVSADRGIVGQVEARYAVLPTLSLSAFYDVGRATLRTKPFVDEKNNVQLNGGGLGMYGQYKGLSLQAKVAWQGSNARFSNHKNPRAWLKATYHF